MEWETDSSPIRPGNLSHDSGNRRIAHRVGGSATDRRHSEGDLRTLERGRTASVLQLEGTDRHQVRHSESRSREGRSPHKKRQQNSGQLCAQGRREISPSKRHSQRNLGPPVGTPHSNSRHAHSGRRKRSSGHTVTEEVLSPRLAVESPSVSKSRRSTVGSTGDRLVCNSQQSPSASVLQSISGSALRRSRRIRERLETASPRVRQSSVRTPRTSGSKNPKRTSKRPSGDTNLEKQSMVSGSRRTVKGSNATAPTPRRPVSAGIKWSYCALRKAKVAVSNLEDLLRAYWETRGLSQDAITTMLQHKAHTTITLYKTAWKGFVYWCRGRVPPVDPMVPDGVIIVEYLQYKATTCESSGAVANVAAGIKHVYVSLAIPPYDRTATVGHLKEVSAYLAGLRRERPTKPKYLTFPDLTPCFELVSQWDSARTTEVRARAKALFLVRCAALLRSNGSEHILREYVKFTESGVHLLLDGTKESNNKQVPVFIERIVDGDDKPHPLCPVYALSQYIDRFLQRNGLWIHPEIRYVFQGLSHLKRPRGLKVARLRAIIQDEILQEAGIPRDFNPGGLRGACASMAIEAGATMDEVLATGRWKDHNVFLQHYYRGEKSSLSRRVMEGAMKRTS